MTKQYIITGPPCSGKSTLLNALSDQGFITLPEIARQIITSEEKAGTNRFPWSELEAFSELVFQEFVKRKQDYKSPFVFTDRGIPDTIAYMRFDKVEIPTRYTKTLLEYPYDKKVFFTPFWDDIYTTDKERKEAPKHAKAIGNTIKETYEMLGFDLIVLPKTDVNSRINLILNHLNEV